MTGPCPDDRETVSLAFANTPDDGYADAGEAAAALQAWLVEQRLVRDGVAVSGSELERFVRLREAIRGILGARIAGRAPEGSAVRIVEAAALAAPGAPIGVWAEDGAVTRGWRPTGGDPLDRAAAALAADVVDVVCDHGGRLVDGGADARFVLAPA
ncbi:ABATE domain-containing protein [Patulibacter sp.]|uniref:ABATE domain-containing protein n=1 Tax=Patulibacter sp. TaxID=1912859 RepID=UPI002715D3E8|nr:ABATE domain-containing protein [Patulibacter sp.]MDO9408843.1 ABATE domain-containing protein [Patulibacter sp.]